MSMVSMLLQHGLEYIDLGGLGWAVDMTLVGITLVIMTPTVAVAVAVAAAAVAVAVPAVVAAADGGGGGPIEPDLGGE